MGPKIHELAILNSYFVLKIVQKNLYWTILGRAGAGLGGADEEGVAGKTPAHIAVAKASVARRVAANPASGVERVAVEEVRREQPPELPQVRHQRPHLCACADHVVDTPTRWKPMYSFRPADHAALAWDRPPARSRRNSSCSRVKPGRPRLHLGIHALASGLLGRSGVAAAARASVLRLRAVFPLQAPVTVLLMRFQRLCTGRIQQLPTDGPLLAVPGWTIAAHGS